MTALDFKMPIPKMDKYFLWCTVILIGFVGSSFGLLSKYQKTVTPQDLLDLDSNTTRYFIESYQDLDKLNYTYEEYLYSSLKFLKHSTYVESNNYLYSRMEVMKNSAGSTVNSDICLEKLKILRQLEVSIRESFTKNVILPLSIQNYMQSFGTAASGLLNGNFRWLGSYSSCVRALITEESLNIVGVNTTSGDGLKGRYCVGHLHAKSWPEVDEHFVDPISIIVATCLPEECHSITIHESTEQQELVDHLTRSNLIEPFSRKDQWNVNKIYCLPDEDSKHRQIDFWGWLFVSFVSGWCFLLFYTNFVSFKYNRALTNKVEEELKETKQRSRFQDFIEAFSLSRNIKYLFSPRNQTLQSTPRQIKANEITIGRVNIDVFDGIKALGTTHIIYAHVIAVFYGLLSDLRFTDERMLDLGLIVAANGLQFVDIFYIITGSLVSYLSLKNATKKQLSSLSFWFMVIVARYLRLVPAYFLVYFFAKCFSPFLSYGPLWIDYRTNDNYFRSQCQQEPWSNFWLLKAGDNEEMLAHCIPQAWYLTTDFRTLLVLPIFVYLLASNVKLAYTSIIGAFFASLGYFVYLSANAAFDFHQMLLWKPHNLATMVDRLQPTYTSLLARLSSYLVGLVLGHLLYLYETNKITQWPRWFKRYALRIALLNIGFAFLFPMIVKNPYVSMFLPDYNNFSSNTIIYIVPFLKTWMELSIAVLLLYITTISRPSFLVSFMSSTLARVCGTISYLVFLVHSEVMLKFSQQPFETSWLVAYAYTVSFIAFSFLAALILHILYEMPINNLIRVFIIKRLVAPSIDRKNS